MLRHSKFFTSPACKASTAAEHSTPAQGLPQASGKQLRLHNTMTKQLEAVTARPGSDNTIAMYVCGPTTYDFSHIGAHSTNQLSFCSLTIQLLCPLSFLLEGAVLHWCASS